ncbi:MAG: ROK family protein [Acholeplasmataceae bacterium]|nr:MAG: ROK family protein [Acholeplasmataceae bacterium]
MHNCRIDKHYQPLYLFIKDIEKKIDSHGSSESLIIAITHDDIHHVRYETRLLPDRPEYEDLNVMLTERLVKTMLWLVGGHHVYLHAPDRVYQAIASRYKPGGARQFDVDFMSRVYGAPFVMRQVNKDDLPPHHPASIKVEGSLDGARIGFDAGGSDMKVAAVLDGKVLYSNEVVWHPKTQSDPRYHQAHIRDVIMKAKDKLPALDALGVSSAGIYVNNEVKVASLFMQVPDDAFDAHIRDIYIKIASALDVPLKVANDGDVAALAGAMSLGHHNLLGIAMGTSEAGGYINTEGALTGWLNELAFVPVDIQPEAVLDPWSGDRGTGVGYHSQDGIIKLADMAGIKLEQEAPPAEKLAVVQKLVEAGDPRAEAVFHDAGIYFGYSLLYYQLFYKHEHVLLMGRVASGRGGEILVEKAKEVLKDHHAQIIIHLPDEKSRRVGQAVAAASL